MSNNILNRAREILNCEADAIRGIPLNGAFEKAVMAIVESRGKVITTGMGKAGNIATKMAGTLCSTGTPAVYLHPGESAHGDLGLVAPEDIIIAFSTSGKTREVLEMLERARGLGPITIIAITSHPDAEIRKLADIEIDMGIMEEPCRLKLTPSASTTVMLAISDALALVVMEKKGLTLEQYGVRHHGGYLGERSRGGGGLGE
jgi:arabinose-5-phosphate isomerase